MHSNLTSNFPHSLASGQAAAASGLQRWDLLINTRLLELCCPDLDACCRALQRAAAAHQNLLLAQAQAQQHAAALAAAAAAAAQGHASHTAPLPIQHGTPPGKCRQAQEGAGSGEAQGLGPATPPRPVTTVVPRKILLPAVQHRCVRVWRGRVSCLCLRC